MEKPELVQAVHRDYFHAGARIATTNTYPVHRDRLLPYGIEDQFEKLQLAACIVAVKARDEFGAGDVAGSLGPTGWSYRPDLAPPAAQAADVFAEIARLQAPYVDLFLLETMSSVDQARGALMGVSAWNKPVWLAISVDDTDGTLLRSGEPVEAVLPLLEEFNVDALLVNCSMPEAVSQGLPRLNQTSKQLGAYANGFFAIDPAHADAGASAARLPSRQDLGPVEYAAFADQWIGDGATIIGGCCEVGPAHIRELAQQFAA